MSSRLTIAIALAVTILAGDTAIAQLRLPPRPPNPNDAPRERALVDLTGTWVAPVMEDWRWRMVTPLKGDAASIPVRSSARPVIESWDPARDAAEGLQCKGYGAANIMRLPGRIRIDWADDETLRIEKDYGMQTRLLHFRPTTPEAATRQGHSVARWDTGYRPELLGLPILGLGPRLAATSKTLIVETSNVLPGYLRKNGIPHSAAMRMTEYYDTFTAVDGTQWFTITTIIADPEFLAGEFVTTTDYRREPDDSRWNPEPCSAY